MGSRWIGSATALLVAIGLPVGAAAYPISKGTNEVRPVLGVTAGIDNEPNQVQVGLDWHHSLNGPLGFVFGFWAGFGESHTGMELHAGVKYRFFKVHPRVAPFLMIGAGFGSGFPREGGSLATVTALGIRFGGGFDFFATPRIIPGLQLAFDLGPRFTPEIGFLGSVQITFGCSFLL